MVVAVVVLLKVLVVATGLVEELVLKSAAWAYS